MERMKKFARALVIMFFIVIVMGLIDSHITAQQKKWVNYSGDFANFNIPWDYQMDFIKKGAVCTYTIADPLSPESKLTIARGNKKMDFPLSKKSGYKSEGRKGVMLSEVGGQEMVGTTPSGKKWREIYLFYARKGTKVPQLSLIYVTYEDAPDATRANFDEIINSIKLKDAWVPEESTIKTDMPITY